MTTRRSPAELETPIEPFVPDEATRAAVAFLARYRRRTLDAYRHDLRNLFQLAADKQPAGARNYPCPLELYRASMEDRGLAASTIERRLSPACGFYRFAHIDGRIASKPAQYVRRPTVHPSEHRGLDRGELGRFLFTANRFDHAHAALAVLLGLNAMTVYDRRRQDLTPMRTSDGSLVSPESTSDGRCWGFCQRLDARRERARKPRSRHAGELAEHLLFHSVDCIGSRFQSAPTSLS
jgi:hypothetical protein